MRTNRAHSAAGYTTYIGKADTSGCPWRRPLQDVYHLTLSSHDQNHREARVQLIGARVADAFEALDGRGPLWVQVDDGQEDGMEAFFSLALSYSSLPLISRPFLFPCAHKSGTG